MIDIDKQYAVLLSEMAGQVESERGLSDSALEIDHSGLLHFRSLQV
jgi:hypothetical protein